MVRRSRLDSPYQGPPPLVAGLLIAELVIALGLFLAGVSLGDVVKSAGPVIALTLTLLNPTVQELGRRQAKLSLVADEAGDDGVVSAPALPPWPVDADRVVANELAAARETLSLGSGVLAMLQLSDPFAIPPGKAEHVRAREAFERELDQFALGLREWLAEYEESAAIYSRTFQLTLRLVNRRSGAHAEAVTVVLDLPATVRVVEDRQMIGEPPKTPRYSPPRPRSLSAKRQSAPPMLRSFTEDLEPLVAPIQFRPAAWKVLDDGGRLEASVEHVHAGRSVKIGDHVPLLANDEGRHQINWTVYTKSDRPRRGSITLLVPAGAEGPAFGRLHGVMSYPGVPIVDPNGEVVHPARRTDPPLHPPADPLHTGDTWEQLRQAHALSEWSALGLDPSTDGPDGSVVIRGGDPSLDQDTR